MPIYDILDYGAKGDGTTNDAAAIQRAIDACTGAGGGVVNVPAGRTYRTGTFALKSNVELHIERGATIAASSLWDDYTARLKVGALSNGEVTEQTVASSTLILAEKAENIAITGGGTIDGGGRHFIEADLGYIYQMTRARPFTLFLLGCTNVTIRDVVIRDGALWTVRLSGCDDVVIHAIRILNDMKLPNNDGIDLDRCRNVRISDCYIYTGDDAISLKTCQETAEYGPCENITVTGCTLVSSSSALIVGVDCFGPVRNVIFDSCVIQASHRGLAVRLSEEGDFDNIIFSNMIVETRLYHNSWWGRAEPICVSAVPWRKSVGKVRHIRFSNILCRSENGVLIYGSEPGLIEDVVLDNVRVEMDRWSEWPGGQQDIRPCEGTGLIDQPTSAFMITNADAVTLRNCSVVWGKNRPDYFHHALETQHATNLKTENFTGTSAQPDLYAAIVTR